MVVDHRYLRVLCCVGTRLFFLFFLHVATAFIRPVSFYLLSWNYCNLKSKKCGETYGVANGITIKGREERWVTKWVHERVLPKNTNIRQASRCRLLFCLSIELWCYYFEGTMLFILCWRYTIYSCILVFYKTRIVTKASPLSTSSLNN